MTVDRASKVTAVVDVGNTPFVNARIQCSAQKRSDLRHRVLGIALSQWSNPFAAGMRTIASYQGGTRECRKGKAAGART